MSVQNKLHDGAEYSEEIDAKREEFRAYAARFHDDVDRKRAERANALDVSAKLTDIDRTAESFERARAEMVSFRSAFAAEIDTTLDASEFVAAVDAFRSSVVDTRTAFEQYAAAFAEDVHSRTEYSGLSAAVEAFREDVAAHRETTAAYAEAFRADTERLAESYREWVAATAESRASVLGATRTSPTAEDADPAAVETAIAAEESPADAPDPQSGEQEEIVDVEGEEVAEPADDHYEDDESEEEAESMDEVAQAHDEADDAAGLEDELDELPYGTLKKAANALGYGGDLNSATKGDLIEFFSDKDAEEIRDVLEE